LKEVGLIFGLTEMMRIVSKVYKQPLV